MGPPLYVPASAMAGLVTAEACDRSAFAKSLRVSTARDTILEKSLISALPYRQFLSSSAGPKTLPVTSSQLY